VDYSLLAFLFLNASLSTLFFQTACVRSAIARLRREQAKGEIPTFNFISLNGMEMRHPFEAYGKFWEALTGCKHVGSHEVASAKLTKLFTSPRIPGMVEDDTVTVLLLDEIDYLITEKQTVLYDFFDWPKRAAELRNGRRLVVVGISNTLNLAEQLLPSVQSRLGAENRCLFKSYNLKDTISILKTKLKEASPVSANVASASWRIDCSSELTGVSHMNSGYANI
jgi:origin recognition complex subunit 1